MERIVLETLPNGDRIELDDTNVEVYVQTAYGNGLVSNHPRVELSPEAAADAPAGALIACRRVDTPRVGVDGLREALKSRYGTKNL